MIRSRRASAIEAPTGERSRERVLGDDELRLAWQAFEFDRLAVRTDLQALAPDRREAGRSRFDGMARTRFCREELALPAARTKNKRPHEIPLSDAAIEIIEGASSDRRESRPRLFYNRRSAVSGFSRAKTAIDRIILETLREEAEARGDDPDNVEAPEHWQVHDLAADGRD